MTVMGRNGCRRSAACDDSILANLCERRWSNPDVVLFRAGAPHASRFLARDCRPRPPRTGDNANALPPSSRDTGNRISCAGLRAFAATRDSDLKPGPSGIARAIRRTRRGFADIRPCRSSRPRPAIPRDALRAIASAPAARQADHRQLKPERRGREEATRQRKQNGESTASRRAGFLQTTSL